MGDFPGYDAYLVHLYIHSPDYNDGDCLFCVARLWDMQPPVESPFDLINNINLYPST